MADFVATVGLNDQEFAASLKNMEGKSSRAFSRMGQSIEARTSGIRKMTGALSSTVGIATGLLGAFTGVAGVVTVVGAGISFIASSAKRAREEAEKELQARRELTTSIESRRLQIAVELGQLGESEAGRQSRLLTLSNQRTAKLMEIRNAEEEIQRLTTARGNLGAGFKAFLVGGFDDASVKNAISAASSLKSELVGIEFELESLDAIEERRLKRSRESASIDIARQEINLLRLNGNETQALIDAEEFRFKKQKTHIETLIDLTEEQRRRMNQLNDDQRQATLNNIHKVEEGRRKADADQLASEAQNAERQEQSRDDLETEIQIESLRAIDKSEEADALQKELDLRREIRRIESAGFDEETQRRLVDRVKATSATTAANQSAASIGTRSLQAGFGSGAMLINQFFGRDNSAEREALAKQDRTNELLAGLKEIIARHLAKAPAAF